MIQKYGLFLSILFALNAVGCHSQREAVFFELNREANDTLPLKVTVYDKTELNNNKSELNDSVNIEIFVSKDIIIKSTYSYPLYLAHIQFYCTDSIPKNRLAGLRGQFVLSIHEPDKIGTGIFDIDKNLPANDSVHIKFAVSFFLRIPVKDKDTLMRNAKLSQMHGSYKIYDVGKFIGFKEFIYNHLPQYKPGYISIAVGKYHELPFIKILKIPMDP